VRRRIRQGEMSTHQHEYDNAEFENEIGGGHFEGHCGGEVRAFTEERAGQSHGRVRARTGHARCLDERNKIAFAQYYVASRAFAVNQDLIAVTRRMRETAESRYVAGAGDQASAIRGRGEETPANIGTARLEGDRAAAQSVLDALLL